MSERHELGRDWSFFAKMPHKSRKMPSASNWLRTMRPLAVLRTVEDFWGVFDSVRSPSNLAQNTDYCYFCDGVTPTWEDARNAAGGKWSVSFDKEDAAGFDAAWEELCMAAIGEQLSCSNDDTICGVIASSRRFEFRVAVWVSTTDTKSDTAIALVEAVSRLCGGKDVTFAAHKEGAELAAPMETKPPRRKRGSHDRHGRSERPVEQPPAEAQHTTEVGQQSKVK